MIDGRDRRVLVVAAPSEAERLSALLRSGGWQPMAADGEPRALAALATPGLAAVVLSDELIAGSGYGLCRRIREGSAIPIVLVSARATEIDETLGLELGADDFISRAVAGRVLLARLAAVVRRTELYSTPSDEPLQAGSIALDPRSRRCHVNGSELVLSKTEFALLAVFLSDPGRAFARDELLDRVWGDWFSGDHVIDVTMGRLRHKLLDAGVDGAIETLRGVGYRLAVAGAADRARMAAGGG
ncbi:MAG: hypothetical protein RL338_1130 [Chloroflexota bacterium]